MNVDAALERMMDEEFAGATHDSDGDGDYLDAVKKPTFSPAVRADVKKTAEPAKAKGSLAERLAAKHNIKVTGAARPAATAAARQRRATSTVPPPAPRPRARRRPALDRTTRRRRRRPPSPRARSPPRARTTTSLSWRRGP